MEGALVCVVLIAAVVIYWKREPIWRAVIVVGVIVAIAFAILVVLRLLASQIDWQTPSLGQIVAQLGVLGLLAAGILWGMPALIRMLDARRVSKSEEAPSGKDSASPYPEPIQKIDPLWRRLFRKGE